jgi:hypothetical protein
MDKITISLFYLLLVAGFCSAQTIAVNPTGVNVNSQNPTTVFLTFGQIPAGYVPMEALWCGELIPATPPALGLQCRPDTIYGALPARFNRSTPSGNSGFTDIMAIPSSVVRRAYQAALRGGNAGFFYVRRFESTTGGPDQYINVTCRMTGGGARVPFALTNVELKTPKGEPVLFVKSGEQFPEVVAEIQYNGTGRLKGRWEIVQPGEELPSDRDLLTEATLPAEERGTQRRYTQISRFNHFLLPTGKFTLALGPDARLPNTASGQYMLLLRIEAVDDKESDSNLASVGVGAGVVHSGGVASFPMPSLRFFVVGNSPTAVWESSATVLPLDNALIVATQPIVFTWKELEGAAYYRLEVEKDLGKPAFSAILQSLTTAYSAPRWFAEESPGTAFQWRVIALDERGEVIARSPGRGFRIK